MDQPIVNMVGEKVALGPLRRDLVPLYLRWINDFEVTRALGVGQRPTTLESEEAWYDRVGRSESDLSFTIYERATMRPIGNTGLHDVDHGSQTATFGIMIGEKDSWGQGFGSETARLMLDYGFHGLGLHNIMLTVLGFNERAIRAYSRAGFRIFGRRREAIRRGGRLCDLVYMDCLDGEFEGSALSQLWPE